MFKRIRFYKAVLAEILETLCSICKYLETDSRYTNNSNGRYMRGHFDMLKSFSEEIRKGLYK